MSSTTFGDEPIKYLFLHILSLFLSKKLNLPLLVLCFNRSTKVSKRHDARSQEALLCAKAKRQRQSDKAGSP